MINTPQYQISSIRKNQRVGFFFLSSSSEDCSAGLFPLVKKLLVVRPINPWSVTFTTICSVAFSARLKRGNGVYSSCYWYMALLHASLISFKNLEITCPCLVNHRSGVLSFESSLSNEWEAITSSVWFQSVLMHRFQKWYCDVCVFLAADFIGVV